MSCPTRQVERACWTEDNRTSHLPCDTATQTKFHLLSPGAKREAMTVGGRKSGGALSGVSKDTEIWQDKAEVEHYETAQKL